METTKLQAGQLAYLKEGLINGKNYDGITFWDEMRKELEKNNKVEAVRKGKVYFRGNPYKYTETMFQ